MSTFLTNPNTGVARSIEDWVDYYTIGSEGGSAWLWRDDSKSPLHCIGCTGKTRQEAIQKLLELYWGSVDE